jgi:hypothetical protein
LKKKLICSALIIFVMAGVYWGLDLSKPKKLSEVSKSEMSTVEMGPQENEKPKATDKEIITDDSPILIDDQEGFQVSVKWEKQEGVPAQLFLVNLGNHMIDITNFDFKKNIKVRINNKEIPISVDVVKKNGMGHHLSAELQVTSPEFTKLSTGSIINLKIENVYDTPIRNFTWIF